MLYSKQAGAKSFRLLVLYIKSITLVYSMQHH